MTATSLKVLAIDEEQLLLSALKRAGKARALDIRTAVTCEDAVAEIDQNRFDLFLLDFDRRDSSRLELLKTIDQSCPYVPIIVMTTSDRNSVDLKQAIMNCRKQGAWHLLEKPFSLDKMLGLVDQIFDDRSADKTTPKSLVDDFGHEKRRQYRRPYVQPVSFSYQSIVEGVAKRIAGNGILTDISHGGLGMLAHERMQADQVITFEGNFPKQVGVVAWSVMIEEQMCRLGIQFC